MSLEIVLAVVGVLLLIGELFVWDQAMFWHSEKKRDPRNFGPRR